MSTDTFAPYTARRIKSETSESSVKLFHIKPERNLLAAVLSRAISDAYGAQATDRHVVRSARVWLYRPIDLEEAFSFGWVANHLNLDPAGLQETLRNYTQDPEKMEKCLGLLK